MPKAPLLTPDEIADGLAHLKGWTLQDGHLVKNLVVRDFRAAVELVNKITDVADEQNHHPDVTIHWNELTFTLWTHASGGITERDLRLAESIDQIT